MKYINLLLKENTLICGIIDLTSATAPTPPMNESNKLDYIFPDNSSAVAI